MSDQSLAARLEAVETAVDELEAELNTTRSRAIPLLTAALRELVATEIDGAEDLPAASRATRAEYETLCERVATVEERLATLRDVGTEPTTKDEKYAAVLAFAANKGGASEKVAVTPTEVRGCTGVSRRYAYDLLEAMAADVEGVQLREATTVQTGSGTEQKQKALLVDCEQAHTPGDGVNKITTADEGIADG